MSLLDLTTRRRGEDSSDDSDYDDENDEDNEDDETAGDFATIVHETLEEDDLSGFDTEAAYERNCEQLDCYATYLRFMKEAAGSN